MAAKFDGIRVIFDAARFVENAYFIKTRETGYKDKDLRTIILEMFSYGTCAMMSGKKDGIVSMGGFVAMTDPDLYRAADVYNLLYEGAEKPEDLFFFRLNPKIPQDIESNEMIDSA